MIVRGEPPLAPIVAGYVAIDLETRDPKLTTIGPSWISPALSGPDAYVLGVSVAWGDFKDETPAGTCYIPLNHQEGNAPHDSAMRWLRELAKTPNTKIFANAQYDLGHLIYTLGMDSWHGEIVDVQLQAPLLDEQRFSYSLDALAKTYLEAEAKDYSVIATALADYSRKEWGQNFWRLTPEQIADYAEHDARLTYCLYKVFEKRIKEEDLTAVSDIEHRLILPLIHMRRRGVRIDMERVEQIRKELEQNIEQAELEIQRQAGRRVSAWVSSELANLFIDRGHTPPLTPKTGAYSITKEWLGSLGDDPVAKAVRQLRRCTTLLQTFIVGHMSYALQDPHGDYRIHAAFHPLRSDEGGTVTGRFSSSDPNLQNIPARDEYWGPRIRSVFLPEPGDLWVAMDYSSQEPRLTATVANRLGCPGAAELVAAWRENPNLDLHQWTADLMQVPRKVAKSINLGLTYGMGGGKLAKQLGLPYTVARRGEQEVLYPGPEAKELLDKYHAHMPFVRCASQKLAQMAQQRGYVRTLCKRRIRFPLQPDGTRWRTHKALNAVIQGSAADQTKLAFIDCVRKGGVPLLTVHDELGFSARRDDIPLLQQAMKEALYLDVPVVVDVAAGPTWGDATD